MLYWVNHQMKLDVVFILQLTIPLLKTLMCFLMSCFDTGLVSFREYIVALLVASLCISSLSRYYRITMPRQAFQQLGQAASLQSSLHLNSIHPTHKITLPTGRVGASCLQYSFYIFPILGSHHHFRILVISDTSSLMTIKLFRSYNFLQINCLDVRWSLSVQDNTISVFLNGFTQFCPFMHPCIH